MTGAWLRRNRRSLIALPFLLVLAVAANGQRAVDYWWPNQPHEQSAVDADGYARLRSTFTDANGPHQRQLAVRVVATERVTTVEDYLGDPPQPVTVPASLTLWRITLHLQAPPQDLLSGCQVLVLDDQDREYATGAVILDPSAMSGIAYACVPADDPGPELGIVKGSQRNDGGLDDDDDSRPPEYDKFVYVVMPADRRPDRVRLWFELPQYAELSVRP